VVHTGQSLTCDHRWRSRVSNSKAVKTDGRKNRTINTST
jgi:hypothetical protein